MEFGWINLFGAAAVLILMAPNVLYALKRKDGAKPPPNRVLGAGVLRRPVRRRARRRHAANAWEKVNTT